MVGGRKTNENRQHGGGPQCCARHVTELRFANGHGWISIGWTGFTQVLWPLRVAAEGAVWRLSAFSPVKSSESGTYSQFGQTRSHGKTEKNTNLMKRHLSASVKWIVTFHEKKLANGFSSLAPETKWLQMDGPMHRHTGPHERFDLFLLISSLSLLLLSLFSIATHETVESVGPKTMRE